MSHFSLIYLRQSWSSSRFYVTGLDFEVLGQASWFRAKMTVLNSLISKILIFFHETRRFCQNSTFKIEKFILEMSKNVNKRGSVIKTRRELFLIWSRLDIEQYKFVFSFWWNTCHLSCLTSWHDQDHQNIKMGINRLLESSGTLMSTQKCDFMTFIWQKSKFCGKLTT